VSAVPQLSVVPRTAVDATLTKQERNCLAVTIAGFRSSFKCNPERFEILYDEDGFYGVACYGMVDPAQATV
jgi:hypothetical protein